MKHEDGHRENPRQNPRTPDRLQIHYELDQDTEIAENF